MEVTIIIPKETFIKIHIKIKKHLAFVWNMSSGDFYNQPIFVCRCLLWKLHIHFPKRLPSSVPRKFCRKKACPFSFLFVLSWQSVCPKFLTPSISGLYWQQLAVISISISPLYDSWKKTVVKILCVKTTIIGLVRKNIHNGPLTKIFIIDLAQRAGPNGWLFVGVWSLLDIGRVHHHRSCHHVGIISDLKVTTSYFRFKTVFFSKEL